MPWDPSRDLLTMREQLDSLLGRASSGWVPAADLHECDDRYVVTMEVPGMARDQVRIECHGHELSVSGERSGTDCPQRYHQLERGHGAFARVFAFGQPVDSSRVSAELADGVLTITIPKTHGAAPRRVDVR
ncbi:MAG: Hsp20/alpha crystallin family protein [Acidobacteria bacterium]|nr:MAG: Hsp20/alpha crystallin family protein [Acidobacteriota bacterium]